MEQTTTTVKKRKDVRLQGFPESPRILLENIADNYGISEKSYITKKLIEIINAEPERMKVESERMKEKREKKRLKDMEKQGAQAKA